MYINKCPISIFPKYFGQKKLRFLYNKLSNLLKELSQ